MTSEEISERELIGLLQRIENRLAAIDQRLGRMEQERISAQKEKYSAKRRVRNRDKSARVPGQNRAPQAPRYKRSRYRPKP